MPGYDGEHGLPGDPSNEKGVDGDPGAQGLPGIKGMPGTPGNRGIQGFDGMHGDKVSKVAIATCLLRKCSNLGSDALHPNNSTWPSNGIHYFLRESASFTIDVFIFESHCIIIGILHRGKI